MMLQKLKAESLSSITNQCKYIFMLNENFSNNPIIENIGNQVENFLKLQRYLELIEIL